MSLKGTARNVDESAAWTEAPLTSPSLLAAAVGGLSGACSGFLASLLVLEARRRANRRRESVGQAPFRNEVRPHLEEASALIGAGAAFLLSMVSRLAVAAGVGALALPLVYSVLLLAGALRVPSGNSDEEEP